MHYIYGPIPSRRLGRSLGIDPIPLKTCNWNCIYCQLGRSEPLVNERREYVPSDAILLELQRVLAHHAPGDIDFISFVGSGEPTLHSGLGRMIRETKEMTTIPIAVITNGALLYREDVQQDLLLADVVMPTISAGNAELYRHIHRPHGDVTFERLISGAAQFRRSYQGRLWVEVMLIQGINDTEAALVELAAVLRRIEPDEVHVVVPDRATAEPWVALPDQEGLMRTAAILGPIAKFVHPYAGAIDVSDYATPAEAILGIITRHPMTQPQLEQLLSHWNPAAVDAGLMQLRSQGEAHAVERLQTIFWTATPAHFPTGEDPTARRPAPRGA